MLDTKAPFAHGSLTDSQGTWDLRMSIIDGFENSRVIIPKVFEEFTLKFGRLGKPLVEIIGDLNEAEVAIMALGTLGEEAEQSLEVLSEKGIKAAVIRPRVFRPFPKKELIAALKKVPKVLIIDRAVSFGNSGIMAIEVQAELCVNKVGIEFHNVIKGLGGMDVTYMDIAAEVEKIM